MYASCAGSNVTPRQRDGKYLFRAVSYCMHNTKERHAKIRLNTINKIINEWEHYKDFIVDLSVVNSPKDYKNLLPRDGK